MLEDVDNCRLVQQIFVFNFVVDVQKFEEELDLDNVFNKVKRRINLSSKVWWNWVIWVVVVLFILLFFSMVILYL